MCSCNRQMSINDLPVGRSVDETLRLIKAFQFVEKHGEVKVKATSLSSDCNILNGYKLLSSRYAQLTGPQTRQQSSRTPRALWSTLTKSTEAADIEPACMHDSSLGRVLCRECI